MDWIPPGKACTREVARIRVFLDHWELSTSWKKLTGVDLESDCNALNWRMLPQALVETLDTMRYLDESPKEMRGIDVYASLPKNTEAKTKFQGWLDGHLDQLPGYVVHKMNNRSEERKTCEVCKETVRVPVEKGVKTRVACDMLSNAMRDHYDIGVLFMDDPELIPSIQCVQEVLDKHIIHVGLGSAASKAERKHTSHIRSAAWGHLMLEDLRPLIDVTSISVATGRVI